MNFAAILLLPNLMPLAMSTRCFPWMTQRHHSAWQEYHGERTSSSACAYSPNSRQVCRGHNQQSTADVRLYGALGLVGWVYVLLYKSRTEYTTHLDTAP